MSSSTPPRRGLGANLAAFRRAKQLTLAQLSDRSGVGVGTINAIETRGSLRSKVAPRLADALGISLDLLMLDNIDPLSIDLGDPNLMRTSPYHECPVIRWEGLMNREDVPGKFQAVIPNDAVSPIVPAGATCRFEQRTPQYGDAVIVRDRLGALHFRAYRQRPSGGGFVAAPLNRAYATLDSDEHGLTVLACAGLVTGCAFAPRGTNWTPVVDLKEGQYNSDLWRDLMSCREYARQLPSGTDGAVAAGAAGALLGAAVSPRGIRSDVAGWGAFFGAPVGAETAVRSQEGVVRNCLIGRGYRVLN